MSSSKKTSKPEKIVEESEEKSTKVDKEKRQKQKKKKKDSLQPKPSEPRSSSKNIHKEEKIQQQNASSATKASNIVEETKGNSSNGPSQKFVEALKELATMQHSQNLCPNLSSISKIDEPLEQLCINLLSFVINPRALVEQSLSKGKIQKLTPKEYFYMDYTNKLVFIQNLCKSNSPSKYKNYIEIIDKEIQRVINLVITSLQQTSAVDEVLNDLSKYNYEWEAVTTNKLS